MVNLPAALTGGCRKAKAAGTPCTATTVKYDFLKLLLNRLNKGKKRYRVVRVQREFDFEAPADYDGNPSTGGPTGDIDGRLTMRDVILARVGAGVHTSRARSGNYRTVYEPTVSGVKVPVDRGWLSVEARVRHSRRFRFIDTHLESFGDPAIRAAQAKELFTGKGAPAKTRLPVILVGDLNSDDNTVSGDDRLAFDALKRAGFRERSTEKPLELLHQQQHPHRRPRRQERLRPPHRPRPHPRPAQGEVDPLRRHRTQPGQRLLGLRPRRGLEQAADLPLGRSGRMRPEAPGSRVRGRALSRGGNRPGALNSPEEICHTLTQIS